MAKVIFTRLKTRRSEKAPASVGKKRVTTTTGERKTVLTLDANSPSFEDGLLYVFTRTIAKARRENRRIVGIADFVPPKR